MHKGLANRLYLGNLARRAGSRIQECIGEEQTIIHRVALLKSGRFLLGKPEERNEVCSIDCSRSTAKAVTTSGFVGSGRFSAETAKAVTTNDWVS